MKQALAGLMLLLVAGCATVEDFRAEAPDAVISLKLPPDQAALCMTRNLERIGSGFRVDRRPGLQGGVEKVVTLTDGTLFTVTDIKAQGSGSEATVRMATVLFSTKKGWVEKIAAGC